MKTFQTIVTFLTQHIATLARLATVLRCVATCWVLLAQVWNWSNFSGNICGWCMMLYLFGQVHATMLRQGMRTSSILQHPICHNRVAKCLQRVVPNNITICCGKMLQSFGGASKCCSNNVAMCCFEMLWLFGWSFLWGHAFLQTHTCTPGLNKRQPFVYYPWAITCTCK